MKKVWMYIVAAFSLLGGLFFLERSKRKSAESQLENADYKKEDAVLIERQSQAEASIAEQQKKIQETKDSYAKQSTNDVTPAEAEAYWKNRKHSPK